MTEKKEKPWNRCDVCGRFIPLSDFESGNAHRYLETPDAEGFVECYGTLCRKHAGGTLE